MINYARILSGERKTRYYKTAIFDVSFGIFAAILYLLISYFAPSITSEASILILVSFVILEAYHFARRETYFQLRHEERIVTRSGSKEALEDLHSYSEQLKARGSK